MNKQLEIILDVSKDVMGDSFTKKDRYRHNVFKRAVYYKCCKQLTKAPLAEIGGSLGKDHATVLHGLKVFENDIISNNYPEYLEFYRDVIKYSTRRLNKKFNELSDKKEIMMHTIINQRQRIHLLEALLEKIPSTIKMKYS